MDKKVLNIVTVLSSIFTVIVCVGLHFFPALHEKEVLAAQQEREIGNAHLIATSTNPADVVKTDDSMDAQLEIGLPEELLEKELEIENDYITQTVYVRFSGGVDDYFETYAIRGSCDHIASLSYYKDGTDGVIALELDQVFELEDSYEPGRLYLEFLSPHDVYDKVVVVDAGHGGHAPGAVRLGISEKNIDLAILKQVKKLFDDGPDNIGVYYTRTTDTNPSLEQRVQLANRSDADLFISIHNNSDSTGNFTNTSGTQVMFSESDTSEFSSRRLAQICMKNVVKSLNGTDKGLLKGDRIYIIRTSEVPVALIEVGFMTNYEELEKLESEDYQKKAAEGIYNAVMEAFEEGY